MQKLAHAFHERPVEADGLPATGLVRLAQILAVVPVARSTFLLWVKIGKFPRPVRIGARAVAWRVADVRALLLSDGITEIDPNAIKACAASVAARKARKAAEAERAARRELLI